MNFYIGVTDNTWFNNLRYLKPDEVNFWQPGGLRHLRQLQPYSLFLFKLHGRRGPIAGGGYFARQAEFPLSYAWMLFGEKNGTDSLPDFHRLVAKRRKAKDDFKEDFRIGCVMLTQPFFLARSERISRIPGWDPHTQPGRYYRANEPDGKRLLEQVKMSMRGVPAAVFEDPPDTAPRYGRRRLREGQGIFRSRVADAYERRCAVTGERVLGLNG